jgi:hypothetical protein
LAFLLFQARRSRRQGQVFFRQCPRRPPHLVGVLASADAGDRRGGLACVEMRCARHLAASPLGGDLIGRRRPHRGRRRPSSTSIFNQRCIHAQPCTLSSLPVLPLSCALGLGVAHTPHHFGCARRPCPPISAPRKNIMLTSVCVRAPPLADRQRQQSSWAAKAAAASRARPRARRPSRRRRSGLMD